MRILIVAVNVANHSKNGSNSIYLERFLSTITPEEASSYTLLVCKEGKEILQPRYPHFKYDLYELDPYCFSLFHYKRAKREALKFQNYVNTNHYDSVFISHFFAYFTRYRLNCRKIVVIHDIIALHDKIKNIYELKDYIINRNYFKSQLKTADKIIAISKFVQEDICHVFKEVDKSKIEVIRNSVVLCDKSEMIQGFNIDKFILFVGRPTPYKGFLTAIKAYIELNRKEYKLIFVCKSKGYWNETILPFIRLNKLEKDIIQYEGLSNENLKWLYENASLFISPSEHEGFGYTPVEAAICHCPVVSSTSDSLPEATMGLVNYYEPATDYMALSKRMKETLDMPPTEAERIKISNTLQEEYSTKNQSDKIKKLLFVK